MSERRLKPSRRLSFKQQRRMSFVKQEAPATRLYEYLKPKESQPGTDSPIFLKDLALATVLILNDSSDPKLVEVLKNFGWNGSNQYEKNVDVRGLLIALKRLERKSTSFALSSFQQKPSVSCFVPEILVSILDASSMEYSEKDRIVPKSYFFEGVCLLVDISGFTKLSGRFCALGMDGIDDLQRLINDYLGELVGVIYTCGGDVIKFAGDAVLCIFSDHSQHYQNLAPLHEEHEYMEDMVVTAEGLKSVCSRAVECALLLRDIFTEELTVHVALSIGEICFGILGGYHNKFECLISGACLTEISSCLDDAKSRQIVVTSHLWSIIHDDHHHQFTAVKLDSGNYRIDQQVDQMDVEYDNEGAAVNHMVANYLDPDMILGGDSINESRLESFVPSTVISDMIVGNMQHFAELREVVTMFIKFESYDYHIHRDLITLQDAFQASQRIIYEYGGFIRQFLVDDKGCVLIALWGVPTASFVDNAYRALNTAIQLQHNLSHKHDMLTSIGITTGTVFCGTVGSYLRKEYAAIGDSVNMAARLMAKASFDIYLDQHTVAKLPRMSMEYLVSLGKMVFKGKSEPMEVFKYHAAHEEQPQTHVQTHVSAGMSGLVVSNHNSRSLHKRIREKLRDCVVTCLDSIYHDDQKNNTNHPSSIQQTNNNKSTMDYILSGIPSLGNLVNTSGKSFLSANSMDSMRSERSSFESHHNNDGNGNKSRQSSSTKIILIEETTGYVNPTVKQWLREESDKRNLTFYHVVLTESDYKLGGYIIWMKLLKCILGADRFEDEKQLLEYLVTLLLDSTQGDYEAIELVLLPAIRQAFNITYGTSTNNNSRSNSHNNLRQLVNSTGGEHVALQPANKIPPRLMHETVERVIAYTLQRGGYFLLVERAHFMSEESLKVMFLLRKSLPSSLLMLCAGTHSNNASMNNANQNAFYNHKMSTRMAARERKDKERAFVPYSMSTSARLNDSGSHDPMSEKDIPAWVRRRLNQSPRCHIISLTDYNVQEILDTLKKTHSQPSPTATTVATRPEYSLEALKKLADLIYQVSAGNPFWVEEILDFIHSSGIGSFMHMLLTGNVNGEKADNNGDKNGVDSPSVSFARSNSSIISGGMSSNSNTPNANNTGSMTTSLQLLRRNSSAHRQNSNNNTNHDSKVTEEETINALNAAQQQQFDMSKLETFIICRFEQLSSDDQKVARIASVVGHTFDRFLLYAILPRRLKAVMYRSLRVLTETKWISSLTNDDAEYAFNHPFIASTLAKLNPGKEKRYIHRCCAQFLEEEDVNNSERLALEIIRHYGECDESRAFDHCIALLERRLLTFTAPSLQLNINPQLDEIVWRLFFLACAYANDTNRLVLLRKLAQRYQIEVDHCSQQQLLAQIHNDRQNELLSQVQNPHSNDGIVNNDCNTPFASPVKQAIILSPSKVVPLTENNNGDRVVGGNAAGMSWWSRLFGCYSSQPQPAIDPQQQHPSRLNQIIPLNNHENYSAKNANASNQNDRKVTARKLQQQLNDQLSEQNQLFVELFEEIDERIHELSQRVAENYESDVFGSSAATTPSPYAQQQLSPVLGEQSAGIQTQFPFR